MIIPTAEISNRLSVAGIKPSVMRIAVMRYLLTHCNHPTVDDIYQALRAECPTLSRTTVYNTLRTFVDHGCASQIDIESGNSRFDGDTSGHGHFMCNCCGRVIDFAVTDFPEAPQGAVVEKSDVYYKGVCPSCAADKI